MYELIRQEVKEREQRMRFKIYFLPNIKMIIQLRTKWSWHVAHSGDMRNAHNILIRKYERRIHLGDQGRIYENN
jgi:hypothetical protein